MINKALFGGMLVAALYSCSQNEQTHEGKIRETIETYLDEVLKNEPISSFTIDSIEINNITPKMVLQLEVGDYLKQLKQKVEEAKALKVEVDDAFEMKNLYSELNGGKTDAFSKSNDNTIESKRLEFEKLKTDSDRLLKAKELKIKELDNADSISVSYYEVIATGKVTNNMNVQKSAIFPFHISKEYIILKEPKELLKDR